MFSDNVWYYIGKDRTNAFFAPEVKERKIISVEFGEDGKAGRRSQSIPRRTASRSILVTARRRRRQRAVVLRSCFGNIGRFTTEAGGPKLIDLVYAREKAPARYSRPYAFVRAVAQCGQDRPAAAAPRCW